MPDYKDDELPEKDFFFGLLTWFYYQELTEVIKEAYANRRQHYKKDEDEAIEMTVQAKNQIDNIVSYQSKPSCLNFNSATKGRGLALLKVKNKNTRISSNKVNFPVDFSKFSSEREEEKDQKERNESRKTSKYAKDKDEVMEM